MYFRSNAKLLSPVSLPLHSLTCICCNFWKYPLPSNQYNVVIKVGPPKSSMVFCFAPLSVTVVVDASLLSKLTWLAAGVSLWSPFWWCPFTCHDATKNLRSIFQSGGLTVSLCLCSRGWVFVRAAQPLYPADIWTLLRTTTKPFPRPFKHFFRARCLGKQEQPTSAAGYFFSCVMPALLCVCSVHSGWRCCRLL